MTIVVKLGGTNGSGKTRVARALLDMMKEKREHGKPTQYSGKIKDKFWYVLGSYKNVCGGMDTISDKEVRLQMINDAIGNADLTDVIFFEGLITGKTYGAIGALSELDNGAKWIYAFMDTPFDVCVERVLQRREQKAVLEKRKIPAPFNPERTMRLTYKSVQATAKRAAAQGHRVVWLPHQLPPAQIAQFLIKEVEAFAACG